jgi:serine/threonine protein kinase
VSGTSRRANEDDLPLLPPLSQPPAAATAAATPEVPVTRSRNNPLPAPPPVAPRGIPVADPSRMTLPEQVTLSNKFQLARQLATREDELLYQALHTGTGRHVQVHMLPSGVGPDSLAAQRMLRAARAAGRVPHPNVLSVVDSGTDAEGRQFIVYEHFAGAPADELVQKNGPFGPRTGAEIMLQVLEALHAMHSRGVVHRNIRPDNVLVDLEGGHTRVKLTGFRYALVSGKNTPTPDLPKGYSRYLAPEARRGTGTSEPSLDIYAAGVLMRFLLSGETDPGVEIDPKAARPIARATEDDPDERFTAENFLSAVGLMIPDDEGGPESLAPPDPLSADFKYMQQRRERESGVSPYPRDDGRIELFPVLMMIEAIYAAVGGDGWKHLISDCPAAEELLPAAGKGEHFREHGVPVSLVARLLATADAIAGRGDMSWLPTIGEAIVKRGIHKFCPTLPRALSPDVLVHCMPVIWSSISRHGEVATLEHLGNSARIAIRGQVQPSLEVCAVVAGMVRAQLRALVPRAELNTIASQALGDAADVFVLSWG